MKDIVADWRNFLPAAGAAVVAAAGLYFLLRQKPENAGEVERGRRAYLNRVGRIVEGQIVEITDRPATASDGKQAGFLGRRASATAAAAHKLLYYSYSISGVTYETAQDVTGMEERLHLSRVVAGQPASVKYDPSNPSNSILLADDWSGLH